jgi:hypothetical protein
MTEPRQSQADDRAPDSATHPVHPQYHHRNRANAVLAWVGIAAGVVFIVAVVFFSGYYIGRNSGGDFHRGRDGNVYPGMMYPGQTGPYGPMGPGMMGPYSPWVPGQPAPTTTTARP